MYNFGRLDFPNQHVSYAEKQEVDWYAKYSETSTVKFHIPARISEEQAARIKQHSLDAYKLTRCKGLARIDYFVADDNTEYLNEINAIPGFTSVSVYPKLWQETGVGYADLVDKLISLALENAI
jgi:D-alanine-D-alanine ligase